MIINKQLFEMLSKSKQEEYIKDRKVIIDKLEDNLVTFSFISAFIKLLIGSLIILPLWKIAFNDIIFVNMLILFNSIMRISIFAITIGMLIDIIMALNCIFKLNKLKDKYFKTEIKIRGNK